MTASYSMVRQASPQNGRHNCHRATELRRPRSHCESTWSTNCQIISNAETQCFHGFGKLPTSAFQKRSKRKVPVNISFRLHARPAAFPIGEHAAVTGVARSSTTALMLRCMSFLEALRPRRRQHLAPRTVSASAAAIASKTVGVKTMPTSHGLPNKTCPLAPRLIARWSATVAPLLP